MALVVLGAVALTFPVGAAGAQDAPDPGVVEVFEVSGLLDPVLADAIENGVREANASGARALVLQMNSKQAVIGDERLNELAALIDESPVPVHVWVGPSGSKVHGRAAQLVAVADRIGVSIGSTFGGAGDQVLDPVRFGALWGENQTLLETTDLNWQQAVEIGIVECDLVEVDELGNALTPQQSLERCANPTLGDFLVSLDEFDTEIDRSGDEPRLKPLTRTRLATLSLLDQLMHTVASPPVAYLLLVIGLGLLIFEFFSVGIGIAGVIGAVLATFGGYGLAVLPHRTWALVLLVLAMVAFAVDVQTAVPRAWTAIGMVLFVVGTLFLYEDGDASMSWIPMVVGVVGIAIVMYRGMPIMVRGRFATTAIDRSFLLDERGVVTSAFTEESGSVMLREAEWPARSTAQLAEGARVVVRAVDDTIVEVEPVP